MSRDFLARVLMLLASLSALGAFAAGVGEVGASDDSAKFVVMWRTLGFVVFAGLFALLAFFPRAMPGLWELTFLHKAGMAAFAFLAMAHDPQALLAGYIDAALALVIALCYLLTAGYRNWSRGARD